MQLFTSAHIVAFCSQLLCYSLRKEITIHHRKGPNNIYHKVGPAVQTFFKIFTVHPFIKSKERSLGPTQIPYE